jgi:hypothetical protein
MNYHKGHTRIGFALFLLPLKNIKFLKSLTGRLSAMYLLFAEPQVCRTASNSPIFV